MADVGDSWDGIMITYEEQDFPSSEPYMRTIPGWQCKSCGAKFGTSGLPPNPCKCGQGGYELETP